MTSPSRRTSSPHSSRASRTAATGQRLAAIDVSARKHPSAVARLDGAPHQDDPIAGDLDDRADGDLRVEIEDEPAPRADRPLRFGALQQAAFERAAASRAEGEWRRFVLRIQRGGHTRLASASCPAEPDPQYNSTVMSILKVARMGHPVLRAKARAIERSDHQDRDRAEAHRRHARHDGRVSRRGPGGAAGPRRAAAVCRVARCRRGRRAADEPYVDHQPGDLRRRQRHRRRLGRMSQHPRRARPGAAGARDQSPRARSSWASASS